MSSELRKEARQVVVFVAVLAILVWLLLGCCPCRHLTTSTQDSLRVEVVERIVEVRDTAYIDVPGDKQVVTTQDTTSYLENSYAMSRASIVKGGLYHDLITKGRTIEIPFTAPTLRRDSVVYFNSHSTEIVEVAKPLSWWQQTQIKGFWIMALITALYVLLKIAKAKMGLFLRK